MLFDLNQLMGLVWLWLGIVINPCRVGVCDNDIFNIQYLGFYP